MPNSHDDDGLQAHHALKQAQAPPPLARFLLEICLGKDYGDIKGDMAERFQSVLETDGVQTARRLYWVATLGCVWPIVVHTLGRSLSRLVQVVFGVRRQYAYAQGTVPLTSSIRGNNAFFPLWFDNVLRLFYVACLMLVAWMIWEFDCAYAMSLFFLGNVIAMGMVAFVSLPCLIARQWRRTAAVIACAGLALFSLSCVDQNVDKALYRLDSQIRPGMTQTQVDRLATQHFPAQGRFGPPCWAHSEDHSFRRLIVGRGEMLIFLTSQGRVKSSYVQD